MPALIETWDGKALDALDYKLEDVNVSHLALSLGNQCRFGGYVSRHYTIAEHSVEVMERVKERWVKTFGHGVTAYQDFYDGHWTLKTLLRQALVHDTPEGIVQDMMSPIKHTPELHAYREAEDNVWKVLAGYFNVPVNLHPWVYTADKRMQSTERLVLKPGVPPDAVWAERLSKYPPYNPNPVHPTWEPTSSMARRRFLDAYEQVKE